MRTIKSLAILALFASLSENSWAISPNPPTQAAGYTLVFDDNFTILNLAPSSVTTGDYPWYRGVWYQNTANPFNASIGSSGLDLAWTPGQTLPNTVISSCSSTGYHCHAFRYGYFEAQMKWDVSVGAWPAFFMLPVQNIWQSPESGELDVFEGQGETKESHTFYGTIHDWLTVNGVATDVANNRYTNHVVIPGVDFSQWHTYGVLWVPGTVTWYLDNSPVLTYQTFPIFDQQYYYLMLGSQEGVNWQTGNTTGVTASSLNLYVNWVKVWQK